MKQTAEEQIKELKQQLAMANEKIAQLTAIIKLQKNQIFWKKTEVMEPVVDGQQSLFSEQEMDQLQDPDISVTEVTEKKMDICQLVWLTKNTSYENIGGIFLRKNTIDS